MEKHFPLLFGVVDIEKGALGSSSTKVANFTFLLVQFEIQTASSGFWNWVTMFITSAITITPQMPIGLVGRVFANGSGDRGSIPGRVIPKTQKMVLDAALLCTQHYKVMIKGKVVQSLESSSTLPYISV